ncbi:MAG TPA: clostripain-related cysteine peptidase [Kofleriaceae bacterium]|nr:clostripain-related cysteine peptidase [Kofleriaceae bacterium]
MSTAHWNVLLYAIAGKPEEHARITAAITEMHRALTRPDVAIAVQVHAPAQTTRYWLSAGQAVKSEHLPQVADASKQATLTGFLDAANQACPAAASLLVLWAHGVGLDGLHDAPAHAADDHPAGPKLGPSTPSAPGLATGGSRRQAALIAHSAVLGYDVLKAGAPIGLPPAKRSERYGCRWGPDPNSGEFLTNVSMKQAIAASARGKVDVLALNACWMGALEVLYELRNIAAFELACQVYARPWSYGAIIAALVAAPTQSAEQLARHLVAIVHDEIKDGKRDDALAAVHAGPALDALATALDAYVRRVLALIESDWPAVEKAVLVDAQRIDDPYQVDLRSLVSVLGKHDPETHAAAKAVLAQIDATVIANTADPKAHPDVHGLSIFCPKNTHVDLIDAYQGTDFRTHLWVKFLSKFQRRAGSS